MEAQFAYQMDKFKKSNEKLVEEVKQQLQDIHSTITPKA